LKSVLRVLVVDDDMSISMLLSEILKLWQHEVVVLHNSMEAAERLKHESYDIVFTDVLMPELNGIDLLKKALEVDEEYAKRFVFITGLSTENNSELTGKIVLEKPFKIKDVQLVLEEMSKNLKL
jgi:two-component system, cell cycle response regulator CpdR